MGAVDVAEPEPGEVETRPDWPDGGPLDEDEMRLPQSELPPPVTLTSDDVGAKLPWLSRPAMSSELPALMLATNER